MTLLQYDLTDHIKHFHRDAAVGLFEEGVGDGEVGRVRVYSHIGVRLVAVDRDHLGVAEVAVDIDLLESVVDDAFAYFTVQEAVVTGLGRRTDGFRLR